MNKDLKIKLKSKFKFYPVTKINWKDFENLFGEKGACAGCWCMYWRMRRKDYDLQRGSGTKKIMKNLVNNGTVPGIIAYDNNKPVGWCSVAPREDFPVLENSRVLKRIDEKPVWSIVCFFIQKEFRKKGLSLELLNAAITFVKMNKGKIIEGYPVEPKSGKTADVFAWTGLASAFRKAGFKELERRSETRPIMRYII
ncbi:MAG: GNAT family N-acetyltransferase [Ignavibacteriota bacterium]|jgi:GNAT superfamily N-acetyltransferase|nr:MAG: N-acetyltransferase [Chlorobiota bacterium]MBE7477344.1 GNAT family N-acetyltransferase [Ignavibacteriales bacterium]MBL1122745.1 N-acetyltransferase [Ignavibacteriota bacterium]MCC7095251.1 GNAT family N-acetyltransferase [Ignavibacteriaceae bacterium]MCE7856771.1 N-acetyltransferase [Ignavibacteria bacterium CHB3]MEB2295566.1 GNAT family N-acetyltransferase [Ignavibacteria bacterium]